MRNFVIVLVLGVLVWQGYARFGTGRSETEPEQLVSEASPASGPSAQIPAPVRIARFKCDGRTRCSQMTSCEEANYFLRNCPGVEMDGDNDGVPCERQWCK
jgi:hypothetical protein